MAARTCPNGHPVSAEADYCPICGEAVAPPPPPPPPPPPSSEEPPPPPPPPPSGGPPPPPPRDAGATTERLSGVEPVTQQLPPVPAAAGAGLSPVVALAVVGSLAVIVSAFLSWIFGVPATDVPIAALFSDNATSGPGLGWVLLGLGVVGGGLAFMPPAAWGRRLAGALALVLAGIVLVRLFTSSSGAPVGDVFRVIDFGVWVAIAGAILMILGPAGRRAG